MKKFLWWAVLTLVCIELLLRISGALFLLCRGQLDSRYRAEANVYRILCLGDSFTHGIGVSKGQDYPFQLEGMLNKRRLSKKVLVINKGRPGQNSSELLWDLDENLETYKPDLVIIMIGFNDSLNAHLHYRAFTPQAFIDRFYQSANSIISSLRIYKLVKYFYFFRMLPAQIQEGRPREKCLTEEDSNTINNARILLINGDCEGAEKLLLKDVNDNNIWAFMSLASEFKSYDIQEELIKKVIESDFCGRKSRCFLSRALGQLYTAQGKVSEAEKVFKDILRECSRADIRFLLANLYISQKRYAEAISLLIYEIKLRGHSEIRDRLLLRCYENEGNAIKVRELKKKITSDKFTNITDINIIKIKNRIYKKGIKIIIMSDPYGNRISPDNIKGALFVDNFKLFSNIPQNQRYLYFIHAKGHCNTVGYEIIANNAMNCILENRLIN